jgi:2-aminoadipate transaminase
MVGYTAARFSPSCHAPTLTVPTVGCAPGENASSLLPDEPTAKVAAMNESSSLGHLLSRRGSLAHPWSTVLPPMPGTISFGGGIPDTDSLPLETLAEAARAALTEDGAEALQYGGSFGEWELREQIAARANDRSSVSLSPEQVIITTGSSQALDVVCAVFIDPGDVVISEDPTFSGSLWTFRAHGARVVPVSMDREGIDVVALEGRLHALRTEGIQPKLIYITPDFQNPTSVRHSEPRRRRLVQLAEEYGTLIIEDTAYEEIDFGRAPAPASLLSLAPDRVVQMGTFSKSIGPGLRVGWLAGAEDITGPSGRGRTDMGSSVAAAKIVARFIRDGQLDPHLERVKRIYEMKLDVIVRALAETVGGIAEWDVPDGGFFLWLRFKEGFDVPALLDAAREERVGFVPGFRFLVEEEPLPALRLAFSQVPLDTIPEGIRRLGLALERIAVDR